MQNPILPPARALLAWSRISGELLALVPSQSEPGKYHLVSSSTCSCKGFSYRRSCSHLSPAPQQPARQPLVSRLSA